MDVSDLIITKDKLPKGWSYPLQSTQFASALSQSGISLNTQLNYVVSGEKILKGFSLAYWPPNPNVPYERLYASCSAIRSEQRQAVKSFIGEVALPECIDWIRFMEALPDNSPIRRERKRFWREFPKF